VKKTRRDTQKNSPPPPKKKKNKQIGQTQQAGEIRRRGGISQIRKDVDIKRQFGDMDCVIGYCCVYLAAGKGPNSRLTPFYDF
jgi:hypothetical protein